MLSDLLARLARQDRLALARLLTLVARSEDLEAIRAAVGPRAAETPVVAITGNAGVGKSSLVGKLAEHLRKQDKSVAILACDPQSPLTGGALLGDRIRMPSRPDDAGLYIRSLAAASGHQAVAEHVELMIRLLAKFGFDVILLETVGAGQGDTAVRELADVVVLLVQPESGDELQWEKAGLLEVADVVVVHKADLAGAEKTEGQVKELLSLPGSRDIAVLRVSSRTGLGIDALWDAVLASPRRGNAPEDARELLRRAQQLLAERFRSRAERVGRRSLAASRTRRVRGGRRVAAFADTLAARRLLLLTRAVDAPRRVRDGREPVPGDLSATVFAGSVGPVLNPLQRRFDLLKQLFFVLGEGQLLVQAFHVLIAWMGPRGHVAPRRKDVVAQRVLDRGHFVNQPIAPHQESIAIVGLLLLFHLLFSVDTC